jgi:hypothetical protein
MKLTDSQHVHLREAVEMGETFAYHHTQYRPLRRLEELGFIRRKPEVISSIYIPTARGRAYFYWWCRRYDRPIAPFRCPKGGTIKRYER